MTLPSLDSITSQPSLGKFNGYMMSRSYVNGYQPTKKDVEVFKAFNGTPPNQKQATQAFRWFQHIASYSEAEMNSWPSEVAAVETTVAEDAMDDPFADDDDLFGDDDGAAAEALQLKLRKEAEERAAKKLKNARSMIVLEVKPYEADFDLEALAANIKKLEHEGIQNWGEQHKLEKVAYGICKLVISVVVFDEKCGLDDIVDLINEKHEDDVQSVDIQAMSKV